MKLVFLVLFSILSPKLGADAQAPVKDFSLIDQFGKPFRLSERLAGRYTVISFIFSHCPLATMCPRNMALNKKLLETWKAQPWFRRSGQPLHILAVTLDPERDTPEVLRKFGEAQGLDFNYATLATGEPQTLSDFAAEFNVVGIPAGGSISHNMKTIVVNPQLVEIKQFPDNEWTPTEILALMERSKTWWVWFVLVGLLVAIPGSYTLYRQRKLARENL